MMVALSLAMALADPSAFMSAAHYPAGSTQPDQTAPGGFATSDNFPAENNSSTPKEFLTLTNNKGILSITIANHNQPDLWLPATDSNLRGWLEIQDGRNWSPAQYQGWASCGNSYHKVFLDKGHNLQYKVGIPSGSWKTNMRFVLMTMDSKPNYSEPISVNTARTIMQLDPAKASEYKVDTRWTVPTLLPKDM
ncbi:MAG: hypothetical protein KF824_00925 [Fimbriimonadaceae bacterium]|nr:MAG: hypothetical protein KF824_00925 [Fimbriimonadaceae bacterium]